MTIHFNCQKLLDAIAEELKMGEEPVSERMDTSRLLAQTYLVAEFRPILVRA